MSAAQVPTQFARALPVPRGTMLATHRAANAYLQIEGQEFEGGRRALIFAPGAYGHMHRYTPTGPGQGRSRLGRGSGCKDKLSE